MVSVIFCTFDVGELANAARILRPCTQQGVWNQMIMVLFIPGHFNMLLTTTGYCLPDLRQIQLTVMTIISKGIYHTVHFYHVYLALYTDNLFINCSRLLLFTLIIPIILDFFFLTAKKCWHVFTVLFHTAKSDSCLAQPTQWQVNSIVFSQLYHLITTWVSLAVFEEPLSLRWHCNQLLSWLQVISVCQQETWPPHSLFLPDQLLNISLQFWPPSTLMSAAFYICPLSNAGTFPFTQCL